MADHLVHSRFQELEHRYLTAQLAGDRQLALDVIVREGLDRGCSVRDLLLEVVRTAQYEIGSLWERNRISVADEHVATAVSQLVLCHLYGKALRRPDNGRLVTLACVDGELHDMGARIAADLLEMEGFAVRMLGASVPADELTSRLAAEPPDALLLSVTMSHHLPSLRRTVEYLRSHGTPPYVILAGGHAILKASAIARELGLDSYSGADRQLVTAIERALATDREVAA
jgi:MerR family transcriptional regulator, light-induced transcriptional regulator